MKNSSLSKIAASLFFLLALSQQASATTLTLNKIFNDPTVTNGDSFGSSVAISGNYVLIGGFHDDTVGTDVGQAYLFDAITGNLLHTFNDPTVTSFDNFGGSVSISGNHVLIGAQGDDTAGNVVGQAYLFDAISGNLLHTFNDPTVTSADSFGSSVSISGNNVLVGARGDDTSGANVGQAYLFNATTGNLLHTFSDPTVTTGDSFGTSVAISGSNVLIGAFGDDTFGNDVGQAYLFDATTGNLLHTFNDPTVTSVDFFGSSVAISGNYVLIGAQGDDTNGSQIGQAHLFDAITGNLLHTFNDPTVTSLDSFGSRVAISGNNVLIGAFGDNTNGINVGQAYLFDAITGNLLQTFNDPTITTQDFFGASVAISGNNVLIGAFNDDTTGTDIGQAYLFTMPQSSSNGGIPEPSTLMLLLFGIGAARMGKRRKNG